MRSTRHMLAGLLAAIASPAMIGGTAAIESDDAKRRRLNPDIPPDLPRQPRRVVMTERNLRTRYRSSPPMNGAKECARRVRQMQRGDVLNWYPRQVRANAR